MKSMFTVIKEQIRSFYLIRRLSLFELKSANNNNYLGILWEFLNPMIQICVYWVVFGMGIRGGRHVGDVPFVFWMLSGITLWFFANPAIMDGTKSIYTRINFISKMSFPMSAIPSYVIMSKFYQHAIIVLAVTVILHFGGFPLSVYYVQMPYYMFAAVTLFFAISLVTSTLATIVRDVTMIVQAIMRMLLYLTPLLWVGDDLPKFLQIIIKLNPLTYLVEGYRSAMLGQSWYLVEHAHYTLYFWGITLVLLMIGSALHLKFRNHFVDYL